MRIPISMCALLLFITSSAAQYEQFNNPEVEMNMTRSMMYPTVFVYAGGSRGSGTALFSGYVDNTVICRSEFTVGTAATASCTGNEKGRDIRTYILSAWHILDNLFSEPPLPKRRGDAPEYAPLKIYASARIAGGSSANMKTVFKKFEALIIAKDEENDLVLLSIKEMLPFTANTAPRDVALQPFRMVWALGSPLGHGPMPTGGYLAGTRQMLSGKGYFLSNASIYGGNSGGGLFHYSKERKRFELIAVSKAIGLGPFGPVPHIVLSIPIETVHDFLEKNSFGFIAQ